MNKCVFLVSVLCCATCTARDIFVDNVAGNDANTGGAPTSAAPGTGPCRTIGRALQLARRGDTIYIANTGQPYRESLTLQAARHSGYETQPLVIEGNGAILDGSWPVGAGAWEHVQGDVFRFRPHRSAFQQLFLNDRPLVHQRELPVAERLQPLQWALHEGHIYFRVEKDRLPHQYPLHVAGHPVGITLYDVRHVIVRNLIVQGFQLDGINAHDNVFDATLEGLVCRGNGRSGISIGGASRVTVRGCIVGDNGAAQVRTEGYCRVTLTDCQLIGNTAPELVREGGTVVVAEAGDGR